MSFGSLLAKVLPDRHLRYLLTFVGATRYPDVIKLSLLHFACLFWLEWQHSLIALIRTCLHLFALISPCLHFG